MEKHGTEKSIYFLGNKIDKGDRLFSFIPWLFFARWRGCRLIAT